MIFNSNKHYSPLSDRHPDAPARSAILLVSSPFDPSAHAATSVSPTHLEGLTALTAAMSLVKLACTNADHFGTWTASQSSVQSLTRVFAPHHGFELARHASHATFTLCNVHACFYEWSSSRLSILGF